MVSWFVIYVLLIWSRSINNYFYNFELILIMLQPVIDNLSTIILSVEGLFLVPFFSPWRTIHNIIFLPIVDYSQCHVTIHGRLFSVSYSCPSWDYLYFNMASSNAPFLIINLLNLNYTWKNTTIYYIPFKVSIVGIITTIQKIINIWYKYMIRKI